MAKYTSKVTARSGAGSSASIFRDGVNIENTPYMADYRHVPSSRRADDLAALSAARERIREHKQLDVYYKRNPARRKKPAAPSVKTVSLKNFTGKLRINPGVPAGAVVVTGVGSRSNISRKKSKKVAKFMVGSGVPAWKRKGKAMLAKLRRNPAPRGFKVSGDKYARVYPSHEAAKKAARKFEERGFYTWIHGDPRGARLAIKHYSKD